MILNDNNQISNGHILIADDDLFYRKLLANYLCGEMFTAATAEDGDKASHLLIEKTFDLCIFDFYLPGKPLDAIIHHINMSVHHIPFIIMTGDESCETERIARGLGPVFYFVKPFALSDFGSVVKEVVGKASVIVNTRPHWSVHHE